MSATKTQTRPAPLSEAQRQVLTAAAQRPEGAVILPARLKGKAAQTPRPGAARQRLLFERSAPRASYRCGARTKPPVAASPWC